MINAVFVDFDGTLCSFKTHRVPPSAVKAMRRARARGVRLVLATGRHTLFADEAAPFEPYPFDGYIGINGQLCHLPGGEVIFSQPLDSGDIRRLLENCGRLGIPCSMVGLRRTVVTAVDDRVRRFNESIGLPPPPVGRPEELEGGIFSLMPYMYAGEEAAVMEGLRHSAAMRWSPLAADIVPSSGGKHVGMQRFLDYFGLAREECMALGDGENDISMLRLAGIGVAMGGGLPEVLAAADVVAPAPEEDGFCRILEQYGVI